MSIGAVYPIIKKKILKQGAKLMITSQFFQNQFLHFQDNFKHAFGQKKHYYLLIIK